MIVLWLVVVVVEVVEVEVEVVKNKGGLICHLTWRPSFESLSYRSLIQMIGSEPVRIYNQSNVLDLKLVEKSIRTGIYAYWTCTSIYYTQANDNDSAQEDRHTASSSYFSDNLHPRAIHVANSVCCLYK